MGITTIGVGERSPFPSPEPGQSALAVTIVSGIVTMICQLPEVTSEDISGIQSTPMGLALLQTEALPAGVVMLLLGESAAQMWALKAPMLAEEAELLQWADAPIENNIILVVLVDSNTNLVSTVRTVGAPIAFLENVQAGARLSAPSDLQSVIWHANQLSDEIVWTEGLRWRLDVATQEFVEA